MLPILLPKKDFQNGHRNASENVPNRKRSSREFLYIHLSLLQKS